MEPFIVLGLAAVGGALAASFWKRGSEADEDRANQAAEATSLTVISKYLPERSLFDVHGEEQRWISPALLGPHDGYRVAAFEWGEEEHRRTSLRLKMPSLRLGFSLFSPDFVGTQPTGKWFDLEGSFLRLYPKRGATLVSAFLKTGALELLEQVVEGRGCQLHIDDEFLVLQFMGDLSNLSAYLDTASQLARGLADLRQQVTPSTEELSRVAHLVEYAEAKGYSLDIETETVSGRLGRTDFSIESVIVGHLSQYRIRAVLPLDHVQFLMVRDTGFLKEAKGALGPSNSDLGQELGLLLHCWSEHSDELHALVKKHRPQFSELLPMLSLLEFRAVGGGLAVVAHCSVSPELSTTVAQFSALLAVLQEHGASLGAYR